MASGDDPAFVPTISVTPRDATDDYAPRDRAVALALGERIANRYVVRSFLGEGGMGAVYRALDETLGEEVALKVVRGSGINQALRDEVRLAQKVTHANVCRTYDLEEAGGHHFVKMELVAGETLAARLLSVGRLEIAEAVRIALAIADGLAAAHAQGIVHRDLKPGNVMLSGHRVVLMDFGIAHMIAGPVEGVAGTVGYMAPEQLTGRIDGRTDLYALGCVLYEMLAGKQVVGDATDVRFIRLDTPSWLARAVSDLLAKVPERRDAGVARLRAGRRSHLHIVVPIAIAVVALASVALWYATRARPWQPDIVHFEAFEEYGSTASLSPDGAWLVFDSDRAQHDVLRLYVMSRATGNTVPLATPPGVETLAPYWTRDGSAILYQATIPGGDHIYRQPVAGTPPAISGPPVDLGHGISPAPCGDDAIVYVDSGPVTKHIILLSSDGSRRTLATIEHNEAVATPRCDPTGDHVVFVHGAAAFGDSGNDVYVADRNGVTRQLTTDHATSSAMFTADGRSIVFAANHGGTRDLFEIAASGGVPRRLMVGDAGAADDVSRDGRVVVFHRDDSSIFPVLSDGNVARLLTSRRGTYLWPRPAGPDRIVARRANGSSSEIVTIRISDGAITVLANGFTGFPSLDNTRVYFRTANPSNVLMAVPIDGGPATVVASLPGNIMLGADGPDGPHVVVETGVGVVAAYRVVGGHAEAEGAGGLVTVAPSGGWRAVTVLFANTGGNTHARLLLIPPGAPLSAPAKQLDVASVHNLWLDDHRIGYCGDGSCHVLDVTTGATEDVPVYPRFYEHGAIVMPDGKHIVDSLDSARITRHAVTNFDAR